MKLVARENFFLLIDTCWVNIINKLKHYFITASLIIVLHTISSLNKIMFIFKYYLSQIFKINLMDYSTTRRYYSKIFKCSLSPFQKFKSFIISLKFYFFILKISVFNSCDISLNRMIYYKIYWDLRINMLRVFT